LTLDMLSYSPDGHFLVGFSGPGITIWDIQTGGVVKEIECSDTVTQPESLVWSSDGQTIGTVSHVGKVWIVCVYDIDLGVRVFGGILESFIKPCLWSHNNSLQAMTMLASIDSQAIVSVFGIWPTPTEIPTTFSIKLDLSHVKPHTIISFSPAVYRISAITCNSPVPTIVVLDIQNSKVLLLEMDNFNTTCFSPDGGLLVTSKNYGDIDIWKYCSEEGYTLWMRFPAWRWDINDQSSCYLFSPTSLSLLVLREFDLEVKHLDCPKTTHENESHWCEQFSTDGTYVVTAPHEGQVVTITKLDGIYSWSIKTGFSVYRLALTGNVLLVLGHNEVVGWQLIEAGMMHKGLDDGVLDQDSRLWTVSVLEKDPQFWVGGCIGVIASSTEHPFCYNTETGEELEPILIEAPSSPAFIRKQEFFIYRTT